MTDETDNTLLLDHVRLVEALYTVATESDEAEMVRVSFAALSSTAMGQQYLAQHPVVS